MHSTKTLLAAAGLAVLTAAGMGSAAAAPFDRHMAVSHQVLRHDLRQDRRALRRDEHRIALDRMRILASLRRHHVRPIGEPFFLRGHAVVKVSGRFGRATLIAVDPRTGVILGAFRT